MANEPLYKYRSLDNWKFVLDAIVNSRLYAATFDTLNDPMEGRYYYFGDDVTREFRRAIFESRKQRRICSLSRVRANTLLWAYYGGGHKGISLGVRVSSGKGLQVRGVKYDSGVQVRGNAAKRSADAAALDILTQKQSGWVHEQEVRVFTGEIYVPISIVELVLGCLIEPDDEKLVVSIAKKWHPKVKIIKLNRSMMDKPLAVELS